MLRLPVLILLPLLCCSSCIYAWGFVGHGTVAAIAEPYLTPDARALVKNTLLENETMVSVASWADAYRGSQEGKFSGSYHFIDAKDQPPINCNVSYKRDCLSPPGCIVSAVKNYTQRIQDPALPRVQINQALKFLIHFLGDITQPLHDEAKAVGGNKINVTWNGLPKNLHSCWDDQMPIRYAGGNTTAAIAGLAGTLLEMIRDGTFPADEIAEWVSCVDPSSPEECALEWATDANSWICDYVLNPSPAGKELNGTYYEGVKPIIEAQLAKGGLRLAYYLNNLAAGPEQRTVSFAEELKA